MSLPPSHRKLSRTSAQRKALLRNQVTALLYRGKIRTTESKAKEIRKIAEGLIALAVREKDNYETVTVTAKVPRKDANGKRVKEVKDGKKVTVYDEVTKEIKKDSPSAIAALRRMGIKVVMLTGDNTRTAHAIGREAGVDEVIASVLPDGKESVIRRWKELGKVVMVGDGINDAPALTSADIGIAIGAGTDVAVDAADIVVMKSRLTDVTAAIRMSRATIRNIHQNLFWAFFYNAVCIPLAMGLYGVEMKPMYGAAAMALSSFFVCMNALRLNLVRIHDASHDRPVRRKTPGAAPAVSDENNKNTEETSMTKTLKVTGMMCAHCEARVKKALEAVPGVESATADHEKGIAVVTLNSDVSDEALTAAVTAQDYTVTGVE